MLATFSLHSVVTDVGAWCGLAALIGLALLVLLYFAQARELRRISDWIENEEERRGTAPGPGARATVMAQGTPPPPPQAAVGTVTTAVPGVRRVAVPPTSASGPPPGAVLAPATAAGAAVAAQVPEQANGDGPSPADAAGPQTAQTRVVAIPVAAPDLPAEAFADEAPPAQPLAPEPAGEAPAAPDAPAGDPRAAATSPTAARPSTPDGDDGETAADGAVAEPGPGRARELAELEGADAAVPATPAPAAVPLVARRIPTAEPQRAIAGGVESRAGAASPLDLLRAEPPGAADLDAQDTEPPPPQPSTAAGARTRFPPAPPVRVQPPRGDDVTIRAPGRGAPGGDRTERGRRRERDPGQSDPRERDPREDDAGPPRTMASTLRLLGAAVVIVAILIFVATQLLGGSGSPTTPPSTHTTTTTTTHSSGLSPTAGVVPGNITVAVLNGTSKAHLASGAMSLLTAKGFVKGAIANAPTQSDATSSVGYTRPHRKAALAIAAALGLSAAAVRHVDSATYAQARRNGAKPQVVVTLGADYAAR